MTDLMPAWREVSATFDELEIYGEVHHEETREWVNFINHTDMGDVVVGATFDSVEVRDVA